MKEFILNDSVRIMELTDMDVSIGALLKREDKLRLHDFRVPSITLYRNHLIKYTSRSGNTYILKDRNGDYNDHRMQW